jgi:hypothetical protein
MILKRIFSAILIATILLQTCGTIAVVVSFKINQDYISTYLCVNRDKPQMQCNGKCVLMQRMQQEVNNLNEQNRQKTQHIIEHEVLMFCQNVPELQIHRTTSSFAKALKINVYARSLKPQSSTAAVFHPPAV